MNFKGAEFVPAEFVVASIPMAPKTPEEVKEIIDEGIELDTGAFVVEAYGTKNGKKTMVETHISAPGIIESYELTGMSSEQYLTGQSGFLFTKLLVNDKMDQKGLLSSDMLSEAQVDQYMKWANELKITAETTINLWWK